VGAPPFEKGGEDPVPFALRSVPDAVSILGNRASMNSSNNKGKRSYISRGKIPGCRRVYQRSLRYGKFAQDRKHGHLTREYEQVSIRASKG